MRLRILAIDLGSSKTELILYDRKLTVLDRIASATSFDQTDGVKTLDADRFIEELLEAAGGLGASSRPGGRRGAEETLYVSTTGMGSTIMAVRARGGRRANRLAALSPVLSWETALPGAAAPPGGWTAVPLGPTGKTPLPSYPLYKIPELMRRHGRGARFACLHDFIYARLTGSDDVTTDYSLASRSLLFDDSACAWDAGILGALGLGPDSLPAPVPAGTILGRVRADLRRRLGWPADSFVFAGMHDHLATGLTGLRLGRALAARAASAPGAVDEDFLVNPAGTTESLIALVGRSVRGDRALVTGAPGRRLNTESGWDESVLALVCYPCLSGEVLLAVAGRAIDAELCLAGLRRVWATPPRRRLALDDPGFVRLRGAGPVEFSGILAARVAAVQFELKSGLLDMQAALAQAGLPADPRGIICLGGQARQAWLGRLKAAVLGRPVWSLAGENCAALGLAVRFTEKNFPAARRASRIGELAGRMERFDPEPGLVQAFEAAYGEYIRTTAQWGKHR